MPKWPVGIVVVVLVLIFFFSESGKAPTLEETINGYKESWGIEWPTPVGVQTIWRSKSNFHGDGEWYTAYDFSGKTSAVSSQMTVVTAYNTEDIQVRIRKFVQDTISLYTGDEKEKVITAFKSYPLVVQEGDAYYCKSKNEGYDYVVAVWKAEEQKFYTMEWHQ